MKRIALLLLILALVACSTSAPTTSTVPGHGAISIRIDPNPIVATNVRGDTYDFPFEVIVRETGGRAVNIQRVTATVRGPGGFALGNESWSAEKIHDMGYPTSVNANSELRYRFTPRKSVPDDRLFGSVAAELRVEATDDAGVATTATTSVTITR